jgi:cellobiose phosphorylase
MKTSDQFRTKYGHFSPDGTEYIITTPETPRPWTNVISNGDYGVAISQTGSGYSWRTHAQLNRITRWEQDLVRDEWGKYIYIRDERGRVWSAGWKPVCGTPDRYECRHGIGYTAICSRNRGIETELLVFVPNDEPVELWRLKVKNTGRTPRKLRLFTYLEWGLGAAPDWHREFHKSFIETEYDAGSRAVFATKRLWEVPGDRGHWNTDWPYVAFHSSSRSPVAFDTDKESFLGMYGSLRMPAAVRKGNLGKRSGNWLDPIGSLAVDLVLEGGEESVLTFTVGAADSRSQSEEIIRKYRSAGAVENAFEEVRRRWKSLLGTLEVSTPDKAMNIMTNVWLKYQAISGRLWARTAYFQTGGAYGFRDQLQDSQVFLPIDPEQTARQLRLHARHQFKDGSVYHWWHPMSEIGLRNAISDNLLWLPFVLVNYLRETADFGILQSEEPFLDDNTPSPLYDHAVRAIDLSLGRISPRGLPLIGQGDWNDGLSAVGLEMKGESVWLGHFLYGILKDFAGVAERTGDGGRAALYREKSDRLRIVLNTEAWDGEWYFRATKDSGGKIGSRENAEGQIFLNAQTWAVINGVADPGRAGQVMDVVEKKLLFKAGPVLLHPAYRKTDRYIGYLTRYAAGMRENGGVYTHAATWAIAAESVLRRGKAAFEMYSRLNPVLRGMHPDEYCVEPYVTAGNIEGPDSAFYGRGGWTWYTGSAAWLFRVGVEQILGVRPSFDGLTIDPCIPPDWREFSVRRTFRGAVYHIVVKNPYGVETGVASILLDGRPHDGCRSDGTRLLPVFQSGSEHRVDVVMGKDGASS